MANTLAWLDVIIADMTQANVAIPIIFATATSIAQLVRAAKGEPPLTPDELFKVADAIDAQVATNRAYGQEEMARLRAMIAAKAQQP